MDTILDFDLDEDQPISEKKKGVFCCKSCFTPLFNNSAKFDGETGWPSFSDSIQNAVRIEDQVEDFFLKKIVLCSGCGIELGFLFDDGSVDTGLRYCIHHDVLDF